MATVVLSRATALWTAVAQSALHRGPALRWWLVALAALVEARYHYWRATRTLPLELSAAAALLWVFYALELFTAYTHFKFRKVLVRTRNRTAEADGNLRWYGTPAHAPLVDILIPTYNEPRSVLRTTILAAAHQDYPRYRVWVLDDGQRAWLAQLCSELNVRYISRGERGGFKAGNLNHALTHLLAQSVRPTYLAVLDADCVAYPRFLERTVALMKAPHVALVQTPQHFHNPDPFQYAFDAQTEWPEEWRAVSFEATSMDAHGAAICMGTAFLARVDALQAIRGFPTDSVQEDKLLSRRLAKAGRRSVFLNERLSVGRSVESLSDLQRQRWRWSAGGMQIFLEDWRAFGKVPAIITRLRWLGIVLGCLAVPAIRLAWMVLPTIYWFTEVAIVRASTADALSYCLPALVAPQLVQFWLSRGAVMPFGRHAVSLLMAPQQVAAGLTALFARRPLDFIVTPKAVEQRGVRVHGPTLIWTTLMLMSLVLGLLYRSVTPWSNSAAQEFLFWNAAATSLFIPLLWIVIIPCVERPRHRKNERYPQRTRIVLRHAGVDEECTLRDLSLAGARIALRSELALGSDVSLLFSASVDVAARVVRRRPGEVAIEFRPTVEQEVALIHLVLCSRDCVPQPDSWGWWRFLGVITRRALGMARVPVR